MVAPNNSRSGHKLLKEINVGDLILHYSSKTKSIFAVSRVAAYDYPAAKQQILDLAPNSQILGRPQDSKVAVIYQGPHLMTKEAPSEHLFAKVELLKEGAFGRSLGKSSTEFMRHLLLDDAMETLNAAGVSV